MANTDFLTMSAQELDRLTVIERVVDKRLTQVEASKQLSITTRHLRRLMKTYGASGPDGLLSRKRGGRGNHSFPADFKAHVLSLVKAQYHDFGPTLIAEKLDERHDIHVSRETLRQWLMDAGIWRNRRQRAKRVHQPRYRRDGLGELI